MRFDTITDGKPNAASGIRNIKINKRPSKIYFGQVYTADTFQSTSPARLYNEVAVRKMIAQNPEVREILDKYRLPVHLNIKELQDLKNGHCKDTRNMAAGILRHLPPVLSQKVNAANLKDAALLHDFGKVLIPPEILNKNSKLNRNEYEIMNLHSELGYRLLKTTDINNEVLDLVRNHHNTFITSPNGKTAYIPNIALQILNIADKYSALTEKRTYKDAFSPQKALAIIETEVEEGKIPPIIYKALVDTVKESTE